MASTKTRASSVLGRTRIVHDMSWNATTIRKPFQILRRDSRIGVGGR